MSTLPPATATLWYRESDARSLILRGYLPWIALLNLAWEAAHVPLYTLWKEAEPAYIAFSVVHCTFGDVLIGGASLALALILAREGTLASWRWRRIALLTTVFGGGYTVISEWMNIKILRSWSYADSMPTINLAGFELGLTPLAQWLVVPSLALYISRSTRKGKELR